MDVLHVAIATFLITFFALVSPGYTNIYYGDKAVRVQVGSANDWNNVEEILAKYIQAQDIDILKFPDGYGTAYLRVSGDVLQQISSEFNKLGFSHDVVIDDVGVFIERAEIENKEWNAHASSIVGTYARHEDILAWFDELKTNYSSLVDTIDIGLSYEGRAQRILTLSTGSAGNKWKIFVEGGMHAREWISPATTIYIIDQLIQGYANNDPILTQWLDTFDWYFLPVSNPDGYEFCHTEQRLWRKNRRPNNASNICVGTDLNRNWAFQWGGVGSSSDICAVTYRGSGPNSEIEVANIVNFISPQADDFILYMAYHSFGQLFLSRWDYTNETSELPPDHDELVGLAGRAVEVINGVNGVIHEAGIAPNIMYAYSGSSGDWARGGASIKYSYMEELRDTGDDGFILPPEQIIPTGAETWAGLRVIIEEISQKCDGIEPPGPCAA